MPQLILALLAAWQAAPDPLPQGFVDLAHQAPHIVQDMRYAGSHNFTGARVPGYNAARCVLTQVTARALAQAQAELEKFGLGLKVYDCYRPQRSVAHFAAWAQDGGPQRMQQEFFPHLDKRALHAQGYIAHQSAHSRGSTVDLTLVPYPPLRPSQAVFPRDSAPWGPCTGPKAQRAPDTSLDMGTGYDCLDVLAHTAQSGLPAHARANRLLLREVMRRFGLINYPKEWWHYTHYNEPYRTQAFNFEIEPAPAP